jgi:hypothetical protein
MISFRPNLRTGIAARSWGCVDRKRQSRKHKLDELGILLITDAERPRQLG